MRTKLLVAIACFLGFCIGFGSCSMKGDDEYEVNVSTVVKAFGLDTIYGRYYSFSIDQVNHRIFNLDSLPLGADTLLEKIVVDTFTASGYITSGLLDSLFVAGNSADLTPAINKPGISFKIYAVDGSRYQEYSLQINVHKMDPDSATWKQISNLPAEIKSVHFAEDYKVLTKDDELLVMLEGNLLMKGDVSTPRSYEWITLKMEGLPEDALLRSTLSYNDTLYMINLSGDVYNSVDGSYWTRNEVLSGGVTNLLAAFSEKLTAMRNVDGVDVFCLTTASDEMWIDGEPVPDTFPTDYISSDVYVSGTGVERAILVGMPLASEELVMPWMTLDGDNWGEMSTNTEYYCPALDYPSVMLYDGFFYILGSGLDLMFESVGGLVWGESVGKFRFPEEVEGFERYSLVVDDDDYIWLLVIGDEIDETQLWRGRLNELDN